MENTKGGPVSDSAETKAVVTSEKAPIDPKLIDDAVKFINEKANESIYRGYLDIGNYILDKFFGGDLKLASSRNPHKPDSYKTLCAREDLVVDPSNLSRTVRVAAQEQLFIKEGIDTRHLTYTHKAALIRLPDEHVKDKLRLAKKSIDKGLSSRQLSEEVSKILKKSGNQERALTGIQVKARFAKVSGLLADTRFVDYLSDPEKLGKLQDKTREELRAEAGKLVEAMEAAISRYRELLAKF